MAESEIIDQVNEKGEVIGNGLRSEFHKDPTRIHPVVHCWLFNKKGEILWQQRSWQKVTSPGKWDMSCGGHILSGDNAKDTLARELEEELGLKNLETHLVEKYVFTHKTQSEFIYLSYGIIEVKAEDMKLQREEVEKVEWIDPAEAQRMVLDGSRESTNFVFTQITKILKYIAFSNDENASE